MALVLPLLFVLSILSPIALHITFETLFPVDRAALLYYPILILLLINKIGEVAKRIRNAMLFGISFSALVCLIIALNFNHTYTWKFDAGTKEVFAILHEKSVEDGSRKPISMGMNGLFFSSARFYQQLEEIDSLSLTVINFSCHFELGLEEFDIRHYSASDKGDTELCPEDAAAIIALNLDYYYLHDCVVNELKRYGYKVNIIQHLAYAGTSLITIAK